MRPANPDVKAPSDDNSINYGLRWRGQTGFSGQGDNAGRFRKQGEKQTSAVCIDMDIDGRVYVS